MYGQLIPVGGGNPLPLLSQRLILGRHPQCDLTLASKTVSGRHCELKRVDGYWWVRDLDSQNGVGVNGRRCLKKRLLPDDTLHVARVRFRIDYMTPTDQASGEASEDDLALSLLGSNPGVSHRSSRQSGAAGSDDRASSGTDSCKGSTAVVGSSQSMNTAIASPSKPAAGSSSRSGTQPVLERRQQKPAPKLQPGGGPIPARRFLGKLVPCGGGNLEALLQETITIGRGRHCDVRIKSSTVSSEHCRLQFLEGYWTVEDLNSSNGVRVDGQRVRQKVLIPGSTLSVAKHRYTIDYEPEAALPPEFDIPYIEGSADGRPATTSASLLQGIGLDEKAIAEKPPAWLIEDEEADSKQKYNLDESDL